MAVDALVLSHGHQDHLASRRFLAGAQWQAKAQTAVVCRWRRMLLRARVDCTPGAGQLRCHQPKALEEADVAVILRSDLPWCRSRRGHRAISQKSFEKVLSPSAIPLVSIEASAVIPSASARRNAVRPLYRINFQHEVAMAFNLKGRGLVVLLRASHRGVVSAR